MNKSTKNDQKIVMLNPFVFVWNHVLPWIRPYAFSFPSHFVPFPIGLNLNVLIHIYQFSSSQQNNHHHPGTHVIGLQ